MAKESLLCLCMLLLFGSIGFAQNPVKSRLANVQTVYLDERSFRFTFSSCGTSVGGMILPCSEHASERLAFLAVLKRWLNKSGFTTVDSEDDADGILRGSLSIDENTPRERRDRHRNKHGRDQNKHERDYEKYTREAGYSYGPTWSVQAWLTNQKGEQLWTLGLIPSISYSGGLAKFHGKSVAKALEHDRKH